MPEKQLKVKKRPSLSSRLSSAAAAIKASLSPIPKYPYEPTNDDTTPPTGLLDDIQKLGFKDIETLLTFLNADVTGVENDDNLLLEHLIQLLAKLPPTSADGQKLSDSFINQLWNTLNHPPVTVVGNRYKYREADGSYNNIRVPQLGAANTPYARTTPPVIIQTPTQPDPSDIFDTLMSRGNSWHPHPNKISSVLFYLAAIIIHDLFQTDQNDYNINTTSSYLDLSPLYGRNQDEQNEMRTFQNGLLKPDCFSSKRVLGFPPGVGVMLIMFNRYHNYIVTQLASINEGGRFTKADESEDAQKKYDNDLFQTGRLITCGLYVNIILRDYVRTILNLNRTSSSWALDPRVNESRSLLITPAPEGTGNQVSAEFNLIYRWHSAVSQKDEKWTTEEFKRVLGDKDPSTIPIGEFIAALARLEASIPTDPLQRSFANLTRKADDTYPDDPLVQMWTESVEDVAGSFGANRVPDILKPVEILGIIQSRYWNMATLNEFRQSFGLTKHTTFEDINPDPEVVRKLQNLYDSPDSVELYPGLVAEKPKPSMSPGSGLCVNFTTSRAILSDAVALVRGDRFYTVDYTPKNLTNWGYNEVNYDTTVDRGHVLYKLVFRAFPNYFENNSIYAHFPMTIPSENKVILENINVADQYSWAKPAYQPDLVIIRSYPAIISILSNKKDFKTTWGPAIMYLVSQPGHTYGKDFCLAGDDEPNAANRILVKKALYPSSWEKEVWKFYHETTPTLFQKYSYHVSGTKSREVDIVRDVINLTNTRFNAALFCLPIKTDQQPLGIYTEQELYLVLTVLFSAIFFDADIGNSFKLRTTARALGEQLGQLVMLTAQAVSKAGLVVDVVEKLKEGETPTLKDYGNHLFERLFQKGKTVEEAVWGTIMPLIAANVANQSQVLSQCLDYYLGDGKEYLPELYKLANSNTTEADETLMKYMLEGCRLRGVVALYRDLATEQTITDYTPCNPNPADPASPDPVTNTNIDSSKTTITLPAGRRILADLVTAGHDPTAFPEPETVKTDRPLESYIHFGWGPHQCAGMDASRVAQTALFKTIVAKKNLRRAPGPRGELKSMPATTWGGQVGTGAVNVVAEVWTGLRAYMTADQSGTWPVPSTMKVRWDEE